MKTTEPPIAITFLTDSHPASGLGHARRCLALGLALQEQSATVHYVLLAGSDVTLFQAAGNAWDMLPHNCPPQTLAARLKRNAADLLVVDTYQLMVDFIRDLVAIDPVRPILAFDDGGEKAAWPVLGVLNGGLGAEDIQYAGRHRLYSALGPRYLPLPMALGKPRPARQQRNDGVESPRTVLLIMGAGDPERQTRRLLRILLTLNLPLTLHVVAGPHYGPADDLTALANGHRQVTLHLAPPGWHSLARDCDLAISGAGLTVAELLYLGVPVAALELADNQAPTARGLARAGAGIDLGRFDAVSDAELATSLQAALSNTSALDRFARRGQALVEGRGAARLAAHLLDVWRRYQGLAFARPDVLAEYQAASAQPEPHQKVLWGSREGMFNRFHLALEILADTPSGPWLDVGAGTGDFLLTAATRAMLPDTFTGLDFCPQLTAWAAARSRNLPLTAHFICQDFMAPVAGEPFTRVTCLGVLQKCGVGLNPAVARLAQLMQPEGYLLVSTKNLDWEAFDDAACRPYAGHHWFTLAQLQAAFDMAGLQICRLTGYDPRAGRLLPARAAHSVFILARRPARP